MLKRKKKERNRKILVFGIMFLLLMMPFSSAQVRTFGFSDSSSNPKYYPNTFRSYSQSKAYDYWPALKESDKCEATSDFIMFIRPGSCTPTIVRSDLLEEQNVPVFCKVDVVKLNPLVDIRQIKSVKFKGRYPPEIAGVSFHPNREAIRGQKGYLDRPLINDIGYVVVLLKRQPDEKQMPDSIRVNITGVLRYDLENFFGAGKQYYYLEVMDELNWSENYKDDSFWKGKGYLRADWVDGNKAEISIYRDKDEKLVSFRLNKGETSRVYYMPGFYCKAGLQVKLNDIMAPVTKARLDVDGNKMWLVEGEYFLDNMCRVLEIKVGKWKKDNGIEKRDIDVRIRCKGKSEILTYTETKGEAEELTDEQVDEQISVNFEKAREYAESIGGEYGGAKGEGGEIWAAKALLELGELASKIGLYQTAENIFVRLIRDYPETDYEREADEGRGEIGADSSSFEDHYITLIKVKTPSKEEASADFSVQEIEDGKVRSRYIDETKKIGIEEKFVDNNFELVEIHRDKVKLKYDDKSFDLKLKDIEYLPLNCRDEKGDLDDCKYKIKLDWVDIKEIAKVSLLSKMPNEYSEADFTFEIGIEKRAIQLSPKKTAERIENLDKSIEKWEGIVENLGNLVKGLKGVCFATSTILLIKNFFANLGGGATARQEVMKAYYAECEKLAEGDSAKFNSCLVEKDEMIKKDIEIYKKNIETFNKRIIQLQEEYKDPKSGFVNREAVAKALIQEYDLTEFEGIDKPILERVRNAALNKLNLDSGVSSVSENYIKQQQENLINRLKEKKGQQGQAQEGKIYYKSLDDFVNNFRLKYYTRGEGKGLVRLAPVPREYELEDGKMKAGFYVYVPEDLYDASGDFHRFYIHNVGADGYPDTINDLGIGISVEAIKKESSEYFDGLPVNFDLSKGEMRKLARDAMEVIKTANDHYGKTSFKIFDKTVRVNVKASLEGEKRCTDFMSPQDCKILFNVCDPVLCPSSRCDLGGNYRVDNVISSGIIGSIALCLPNWKQGIIIPVCLSGIHAGLDNWLQIMKAHRDCLKENLETGRYVGICDEIYSVYLCDFFWRQMGPYLNVLVLNIIEDIYGEGMKGGGEYLTVKDSWKNLDDTLGWMKNEYAVNAIKAFRARSTGEIGAEICKNFVSMRYPNNKKFFDNLLAPDSPTQFHAWFDEIPYTEATVPPTSHYKVYYHIYAGKDSGVNYQVYLYNPEASAYVDVREMVVVKTGFIQRGGMVSETKDFTAPAGYKELCVRINGKDECGFGKVSSGYALNYLADKYVEEQATERVTTEEECISGTPSVYSLLQPNIQAGVEEMIEPELEKKGIVRICSSKKLEPNDRWRDVGYCDNEDVRCYLDLESVREVIKDKGIQERVIGDISGEELKKEVESVDVMSDEEVEVKIKEAKDFIGGLGETILKDKAIGSKTRQEINSVISNLNKVREKGATNAIKAEAAYYQFKIYATIVDKLWQLKEESKAETSAEKPQAEKAKEEEKEREEAEVEKKPKIISIKFEVNGQEVEPAEIWKETLEEKSTFNIRVTFQNCFKIKCELSGGGIREKRDTCERIANILKQQRIGEYTVTAYCLDKEDNELTHKAVSFSITTEPAGEIIPT